MKGVIFPTIFASQERAGQDGIKGSVHNNDVNYATKS